MCGIIGLTGYQGVFHTKKGLGVISNVFNNDAIEKLSGHTGLGHVRYATQGTDELLNTQPFTINYPFGIAMIHNGNIINFKELQKSLYEDYHILLETSNDLELILYTFSSELAKNNLKNLQVESIFDAVEKTQQMVIGAYAAVTYIANRGMLAFVDPYGIRPLVMGKKETSDGVIYRLGSESTCFHYLQYETIGALEPGEAVFIDEKKNVYRKICHRQGKAFCIFEYIYFSREDSIIDEKLVAIERMKMGKLLAKKIRKAGLHPDIIIDVPSSAYFFATSVAEEHDRSEEHTSEL